MTTGKVLFVYRNFAFVGPESVQAALASMCAAEQDRFWDYHDMLFANQTGENVGDFSDRRLVAFADTLGLDRGRFQSCLNSKKYQADVDQDLAKGRSLGVQSTPTFFVNGQSVLGAQSFSDFKKIIDAALAAKGAN